MWKRVDFTVAKKYLTSNHTPHHPKKGDAMPVNLHGKTYEYVSERMASLHKDHGDDYTLDTVILSDDPETGRIQTKTSLTLYKTQVDGKWAPIPEGRTKTGLAEEVRNSSNITTTSALETCETSSIGRALAAAGYHPDGSYASADEVEHALDQQGKLPEAKAPDKPKQAPADKPKQQPLAKAVANAGLDKAEFKPFPFTPDPEAGSGERSDEASDKQLWKLRSELMKAKRPSSPSFDLINSGTRPNKRDVSAEIEAVLAGLELPEPSKPTFNLSPTEDEWDEKSTDTSDLPF